jgi:ankyrin repeat protein
MLRTSDLAVYKAIVNAGCEVESKYENLAADFYKSCLDKEREVNDDVIRLLIKKGAGTKNVDDEQVLAYIQKCSKSKSAPKFDWEKLASLTHCKDATPEFDFWKEDVKKINDKQGGVTLLESYLMQSSENVERSAVRMICKAGVNANHKDTQGRNALWLACEKNCSVGVYKELLEAGADCNYTPEGATDLISTYARCCQEQARDEDDSLLRLFLQKGFDMSMVPDEDLQEKLVMLISAEDDEEDQPDDDHQDKDEDQPNEGVDEDDGEDEEEKSKREQ